MKIRLLLSLLILFGINARLESQSYCIPTYTTGNASGDYISNVTLGSINNTSGKAPAPNFYSDFTSQQTELAIGNSYTVNITSGTYTVDSFFVWIDYNHDFDFLDAGEKIGKFKSTAALQINSINFTVPETGYTGITRMRVRCIYNALGNPCNTFAYGETEDYTIDIKRLIYKSADFTNFPNASDAMTYSTWLDYNKDNLYDLLLCGYNSFYTYEPVIQFVHPNIKNITGTDLIITGSGWTDMNNDGTLEALFNGYDSKSFNYNTELFLYSDGNFIKKTHTIAALSETKLDFKDFDNDGKYDLLISGKHSNFGNISKIYQNTGLLSFTEIVSETTFNSSGAWIDIDNDSDFDAIVGTKIYKNENGVLSEYFQLADSGSVATGDIDLDGFTDFIIGNTIYLNDSATFHISQKIEIQSAKNTFGDYNNNGNLDLLHDNILYENSNSIFIKTDYNFFGSKPYFVDYDYDRDLDIGFLNKIYNNLSIVKNSPPDPPQSISAKYENGDLILTWTPTINDQTPSKALTYNLFISTVPGGNDIISSNSNPANGFRYLIEQGNAGQNLHWKVRNIPIGKYYFGVQSIDNNFAGSGFRTGEIEINKFTFSTHTTLTGEGYTNYFFLEAFDADNDNKLDLAYTYSGYFGPTSPTGHLVINEMDAGPFYSLSINNTLNLDFNQDGNIELLVSGNLSTFPTGETKTNPLYYLNKSLNEEISGPIVCFDIDNDGDEDIINKGYIYEKQKIGQSDTIIKKPALLAKNGAISFADFDLDMDNDLLIGDTLFRNDNGEFSYYQYIPNTETTASWGDYNNDGYPDLIAGNKVFRNDNGNLVFTGTILSTYPGTKVFWADFNNDGYLDIVFFDQNNIIQLFENLQGIQFNSLDLVYDQCYLKSIALSDADNDMDLDIEGIGYWQHRYRSEFTATFTNQYANKNSVPDAPQMLKSKMYGLDVLLSWKDATDDHTSSKGLSYNIIVGTEPWKQDIVPCYSDILTGFRKVVRQGNVQYNKSWILKNLPVGKYYWSAQAIDQAFCGGPWAPIDSFIVTKISPEFSFDTVCLGNLTHFTNKTVSSDPIASYVWDFGDNSVSTVASPSHSYAYSGTFKVTLTAISTVNDTVRISYDIIVKDKPITNFSASVACQGVPTTFLNTTNIHGLDIYSWRWDFGDGLFSVEKDPTSHGYINAGDYPVKLKVTAQNGCADSLSQTVTVASYPIAAVTANAPLTFCDGDSVTLSVPYNADYLYKWKVGGTSLTGADSNIFVAKLTGSYSAEVVNSKGNCTTTSSVVQIMAQSAPAAPYINTIGAMTFCHGDSVKLSVTNTPGYTYQWKRDGGAVGSDLNQFVAINSGEYSLVVTNSSGCSVSSINNISVTVNPIPVISSINVKGNEKFCSGESATLSVPANAAYSYNWRRGPNLLDITTNSIIASEPGDYTVDISIAGCSVTAESVTIEVIQKPSKPDIDKGSYTPPEMCLGENPPILSVDNIVTGYTYQWYKNETPISKSEAIEITEAGNYYLEAVTDICRSERDTVIINFSAAPPKPEIIVKGPPVWFLSTNSKASRFKWYFNGSPITDATGSSYVAGQNLGLYRLAVADESGCFSFSDTLRIPTGITGIKDIDPFEDVKIYPNPTTGMFTIEMNNNVFGDLILDIFTQSGSKILNIKFQKTTEYFQSQIDLSGQSSGMYLINLAIDKFKAVRKILVE